MPKSTPGLVVQAHVRPLDFVIKIKFIINLVQAPPSPWLTDAFFITSNQIRALVRQLPSLHRQQMPLGVGIVECTVDPKHNSVQTNHFFPVEDINYRAMGAKRFPVFAGKGIATVIEMRIERYLKKKYPNYTIQSTHYPSPQRQRQLELRGRKLGKPIALSAAEALTRAQVIRNYQKHRERNRSLLKPKRRK